MNLHVSASPHIKSSTNTTKIMLDVIIALLPASIAGIIIFGIRVLAVIAASVAAAVISEYLFCKITKRENTVTDLSAVVTGLLLALNCPASAPIWQIVIASAFAIIFVKCIFGGIGQNFANPAITARVFMIIAFASLAAPAYPTWMDAASSATPLVQLSEGNVPSLIDLFIGNKGGSIGEVCIVALLAGAIYLAVKRVISLTTPIAFIAAAFLFTLVLEGFNFEISLAWILSGGLVIGAFFMATDYSTTPVTALGKLIFGIGAGLLTVIIRFYSSYPEGTSFAILFMNILTPCIDKVTVKRPFGGKIG